MTSAKAIESLRQKLGISQKELAERVGVTVTQVSRYENGHTEPRRQALKKLAALAESAGMSHLKDFFTAKWQADMVSRLENLRSAGTERPVSLDDLDSWIRGDRQIVSTLETQVDLLESAARQISDDRIALPARVFNELLGNLRGARGEAEYVADEMQLYIGGPDAKRVNNEREERRKVYGKK